MARFDFDHRLNGGGTGGPVVVGKAWAWRDMIGEARGGSVEESLSEIGVLIDRGAADCLKKPRDE